MGNKFNYLIVFLFGFVIGLFLINPTVECAECEAPVECAVCQPETINTETIKEVEVVVEKIVYIESNNTAMINQFKGEWYFGLANDSIVNVSRDYLHQKYTSCRSAITKGLDYLMTSQGYFMLAENQFDGNAKEKMSLTVKSIDYYHKYLLEYHRLCDIQVDGDFVPDDKRTVLQGYYGNYTIYRDAVRLIN